MLLCINIVCEQFLAAVNPGKSEVVDDHKYYEIGVMPSVYIAHDIHEQIYDDPDSNAHVSASMM